ncbi:hypothetical protein [Pseudomonas helvetica]|uniref:hypothetical protein n=1 Tax=Pseudomonas helvetica TaxID=3136738 RepID=UPI003263E14F
MLAPAQRCAVLITDPHLRNDIFAIGAPTAGVFYAVSNIDVLQMQAEIIYKNLRALGA